MGRSAVHTPLRAHLNSQSLKEQFSFECGCGRCQGEATEPEMLTALRCANPACQNLVLINPASGRPEP